MIETGINSIVTIDRTDTLYDWQNSRQLSKALKDAIGSVRERRYHAP